MSVNGYLGQFDKINNVSKFPGFRSWLLGIPG